jgi:hypothetical protein
MYNTIMNITYNKEGNNMKRSIEEMARDMIGDGKTPNKYWVSVSNDYAYNHIDEEGVSCIDYIGDIVEGWEEKYSRGAMVGMFSSHEDALECANGFYIGQEYNGFTINRITIEDRLSGEVYESELTLDIETGKTIVLTYQD